MSGSVQIALDKPAQLNPKQDQTLLNRGFLYPFPMRTKCLSSSPATRLVSVERDSSPVMHLLGASFGGREDGSALRPHECSVPASNGL